MTGQTVGAAVATRQQSVTVFDMVNNARGDFAQVLPSHVKPETFTRLAVGVLKRDPKLVQVAQKNPASLLQALLEAARLGLEPGTKEYHLTPRFGQSPAVLGITGYQGEIELIYRAGAVSSVKAELVYAGDRFEFTPDMDKPLHVVDWFGDRGEILGAYAYAVMADGATSKVVVISPADIKRAKAASASGDKGPWSTDYGAMVLKTAVHRLAKWVPTSAEYRREQLRAVAEVHMETRGATTEPHVDVNTGEILDAEVVEEAGA